jgi:uncharacterized OsmC-like protein
MSFASARTVDRAVQLAVDKYCSVKMSLDPDIPVTWRVILNGADVTP